MGVANNTSVAESGTVVKEPKGKEKFDDDSTGNNKMDYLKYNAGASATQCSSPMKLFHSSGCGAAAEISDLNIPAKDINIFKVMDQEVSCEKPKKRLCTDLVHGRAWCFSRLRKHLALSMSGSVGRK